MMRITPIPISQQRKLSLGEVEEVAGSVLGNLAPQLLASHSHSLVFKGGFLWTIYDWVLFFILL